MPKTQKTIPMIDLFAGPGGLSEGFNSFAGHGVRFSSVLAIEKDPIACRTLGLRSFFHQYRDRQVPDEYYKVLRGDAPESALLRYSEWGRAARRIWNIELGSVPPKELHERIESSLGGARDWVLLGGPPCQAYSLVGRARMTGVGHAARELNVSAHDLARIKSDRLVEFSRDVRHNLYREYLRIVAVHQPAVFVMENVKGILSSRVSAEGEGQLIFSKIRQDLSLPWDAVSDDPDVRDLEQMRKDGRSSYRIYSFVVDATGRSVADRDFLIRSEEYGIPQTRHRVILLGVRNDIRGRPRTLSRGSKVSVRDVIGAMPALRSGLSKTVDAEQSWLDALRACYPRNLLAQVDNEAVRNSISKIIRRKAVKLTRGAQFVKSSMPRVTGSRLLHQWLTDRRIGGVLQHVSRSHMHSDLGRYLFAAATALRSKHSPKLPDWPVFLLPHHRNVDAYRSGDEEADDIFVDRFKVQLWEQPSSTITSHIAKDGHYFIHPDPLQCRSLTVREAARLQTFPDNYFFCGNRTQQYQQIGNAVPPFLASQMAEVIAEFLATATAEGSLFDLAVPEAAEALF